MKYSKLDIIRLFSAEKHNEIAYKELVKRLGISVEEKQEFRRLLSDMVRDDLLRLRKGRWYRIGVVKKQLLYKAEDESDLSVREKAFRALYKEAELPVEFPNEVKAFAEEIPQTVDEIPQEIEDLTHIPFVTIDPADAKDFDDAVAVLQREDAPGYRLYVAIADVSYYVQKRSVIDREAYKRSTSVYVTGSVIPMLPFELSAGICSLKQDVKRLSMVAVIDYSLKGQVEKTSFSEAVIISRASLSYEKAQEILTGKAQAESEIAESFARMKPLFYILARNRKKRGSLDLNIHEAKVFLDENDKIISIKKAERFEAHKMVEEFMLAANEAVAEFLSSRDFPCVYRVHEKPDEDKINEFADISNGLGYNFNTKGKITGKTLGNYLNTIKGVEEESYLNTLLLRSLKQAVYTNVNIGHFGLALKKYCHFTSPIRRYPDLEVHRLLKNCLQNKSLSKQQKLHMNKNLLNLGDHCSTRERIAIKLERKTMSICQAEYMEQFIGEEYQGTINGAMEHGFFVQLEYPFVEGMVHVSQLKGDFFNYEEDQHALVGFHSKRRYRLGDKVKIKVFKVDVPLGRVDFKLVESYSDEVETFSRSKRRYNKKAKDKVSPRRVNKTKKNPYGKKRRGRKFR